MNLADLPPLGAVRSLLTGQPLTIRLGQKLAEGGESLVYTVIGEPTRLAKIYKSVHPTRTAKVHAMLASPPRKDPAKPFVAWPVDAILDARGSQVRGVLIPFVRDARTLLEVFTPKLRKRHCPGVDGVFLSRVAANLAAAVHGVHKCSHVIGDINELNVLVRQDATVIIIDSDSFQISNGKEVFPCLVGRPEYTPPDFYGKSPRSRARMKIDDYFGLAVLIYRILMEGRHPFDASDEKMLTIEDRIRHGRFPHAVPPPAGLVIAGEARLSRLPSLLAELFMNAFVDGHVEPFARPNAITWERVLRQAEPLLARLQQR